MKLVPLILLSFLVFCVSLPQVQAQVMPQAMIDLKAKLLADKQALVTNPYDKGMAALNTQYVAAIDRMIQTPSKLASTAEVPALQKERDAIAAGQKMPPLDFDGTSPAVKILRQTYRSQSESLRLRREQALSKLLTAFDAETEKIMLADAKNGTAAQWPARLAALREFLKDVDPKLPKYKEYRILGDWNITQSNGVQETWTVWKSEPPDRGIKLTAPNGKGFAMLRGGTFLLNFGIGNSWIVTLKEDHIFEGFSEQNNRLRIYGERVRR